MYVNQRVKWPHEFVLARTSKDRLNYNQLNITQWMAGFCRIMRDEESSQTRGYMLDYLIALLDDSNDFSYQAAKASHAVLLCRMEQGEIASWAETEKGSEEQMHRNIHLDPLAILVAKNSKNKVRLIRNMRNQCHAYILMTTLVVSPNTMKQKGCFIDIFAVPVLPRMARSVPKVPVIATN